MPRDRVRTEIPGLDAILLGGLPEGNITILTGGPGAGKTTLGLEFIYRGGARLRRARVDRDVRRLFLSRADVPHARTCRDGDLQLREPRAAGAVVDDVALIDIGLPGMNGYEVARRIRRDLGRGIRLIALTGYGQPEDRRRAEQAGFDAYLVKPVFADQLVRVLTGEGASAPLEP